MTADDAIQVFRKAAAASGLAVQEPVTARLQRRWGIFGAKVWMVVSNADVKGLDRLVGYVDDERGDLFELKGPGEPIRRSR